MHSKESCRVGRHGHFAATVGIRHSTAEYDHTVNLEKFAVDAAVECDPAPRHRTLDNVTTGSNFGGFVASFALDAPDVWQMAYLLNQARVVPSGIGVVDRRDEGQVRGIGAGEELTE